MSGESGKKEDKYEHCYQLPAKCSSQDKQRWRTTKQKYKEEQMWRRGASSNNVAGTLTFLRNPRMILNELCGYLYFVNGDFFSELFLFIVTWRRV